MPLITRISRLFRADFKAVLDNIAVAWAASPPASARNTVEHTRIENEAYLLIPVCLCRQFCR